MLLLSDVLSGDDSGYAQRPLIILQSSTAQTCIPVLRQITAKQTRAKTVVFCLLYPPSRLVGTNAHVDVVDLTDHVPGYNQSGNITDVITNAINGIEDPIQVVIDSVETLASDLGSTSRTYTFLQGLLSALTTASREFKSFSF